MNNRFLTQADVEADTFRRSQSYCPELRYQMVADAVDEYHRRMRSPEGVISIYDAEIAKLRREDPNWLR